MVTTVGVEAGAFWSTSTHRPNRRLKKPSFTVQAGLLKTAEKSKRELVKKLRYVGMDFVMTASFLTKTALKTAAM